MDSSPLNLDTIRASCCQNKPRRVFSSFEVLYGCVDSPDGVRVNEPDFERARASTHCDLVLVFIPRVNEDAGITSSFDSFGTRSSTEALDRRNLCS